MNVNVILARCSSQIHIVVSVCRFRLWFFPRKTRYSPAEALDFLRERKVLPDEETASSSS